MLRDYRIHFGLGKDGGSPQGFDLGARVYAAVQKHKLSYHHEEASLCSIYAHSGTLN